MIRKQKNLLKNIDMDEIKRFMQLQKERGEAIRAERESQKKSKDRDTDDDTKKNKSKKEKEPETKKPSKEATKKSKKTPSVGVGENGYLLSEELILS